MKFIARTLIVLSAFAVISCGNSVEEIHLEADGSGSYQISSDIIPSIAEMSFKMAEMFASMDENAPEFDEDSLRAAVLAKVWEDFPAEVDSVIDLTEDLPDEVKNDPEKMYYVNKTLGFMRGSKASGSMLIGINFAYDSFEEFQGFITFLEETQAAQSAERTGTPIDALSRTQATATYKSTENSFSRTTTYANPQTEDESLRKMKDMFGEGKMQTIIYSKRKIKKATGKNITAVEDYKVTLEYDFYDVATGNANTDFELIFK